MKICIIGSSKKFYSGISAHTIASANAFAKNGHQVSVVLLRNLVPRFLYPGRKRIGKGDFLTDFETGINVFDGMDWNSPRSWFLALKFIYHQKPDVMIFHWWTSSVAHMQIILALFKVLCGKPKLILEMHEIVDPLEEKILPLRLYSRVVGRVLIKHFNSFVAHSNEAKKSIARAYGLSPGIIHVIPVGPYDFYQKYDRNLAKKSYGLKGFVILYFGMIRHYKGVSVLIKAFNKLPQVEADNMLLIIAGEDWGDDKELIQALGNSPNRNRILFKPEFIPDQVVPKLFSAADVVVLPYLRTCGSGVVNLAMAQGKPIITSDLDTMVECLKGYQGGEFFPVGDVNALSNKIIKMHKKWIDNKEQVYELRGVSWSIIVDNFQRIINCK
ncbi:MAG: glycosyltransferase family 4 protein [Firmicutes bacterium]|nr:glycosyltransferase family 4 protein [Bacillota bacterium]